MMESPRKKMVLGEEGVDGGESSESVVLQCTESGAVEQGEEVAMEATPRRELSYTEKHGSLTVALQAYCEGVKGENVLEKEDACVESTEDAVSERKEVVSVRCVDRSLGGRKIILTPRTFSFQNEGGKFMVTFKNFKKCVLVSLTASLLSACF